MLSVSFVYNLIEIGNRSRFQKFIWSDIDTESCI